MNERLEQLVEKASITTFDATGMDTGKRVVNYPTLAELIVKDCINAMHKHQEKAPEKTYQADTFAKVIKQLYNIS
jgi:hypothetical protein